jgi:hypothetical protein
MGYFLLMHSHFDTKPTTGRLLHMGRTIGYQSGGNSPALPALRPGIRVSRI